MKLSDAGRAFIKARESCRLTPYLDVAGVLTVGWGHVLLPNEPRSPISQAQADNLFDIDIAPREYAVNRFVTVEITQWMFDCCVSFTFNAGESAFERSTFLRYINASMFADAAVELLTWRMAGGQYVEGLLNRRAHEVLVFARGEYT